MDLDDVEILLVEDNQHDAELALRALKKKGLANKVFHVKDGVEALEFLFNTGQYEHLKENRKPRLVLLDLKLPKVDGLEVLRKVKADEGTKMIPVVVMTSSEQEQDIVKSYKLGVNSYIVKPVDFQNFSNAVIDVGMYWLVLNKHPD